MADDELKPTRSDTFFSRSRWWWAAAVMVLLVVVGLVYVLWPSGAGSSDDERGAAGAGAKPTGTRAGGWDEPGCAGTPGSDKVPTKGPQVRWSASGPASVPASEQYGPKRNDGPIRSCFQHSPTGALIAAAVISESPEPQALRAGMTPGPGREQTIAAEQNGDAEAVTPAGFRFGACQPARCQVTLLLSSGGVYGQLSLSVVWRDGDWKVDGSGGPLAPHASEQMPPGYVSWGPTS